MVSFLRLLGEKSIDIAGKNELMLREKTLA